MRRLYTLFLLALVVMNADAQLSGDGFYRVRNRGSQRYIYVCDNTGYINYTATYAEMGAIQLWKGEEKILTDPASVLYIKKVGQTADNTGLYDIQAQGTGVIDIIEYSVQIYRRSNGYYNVYAEGFYLCDNETSESPDGALGTDRTGNYRLWEVFPMDDETQYLAINPTVSAGGSHYMPYYVSFCLTLADDMNAYYVSAVHDHGVVVSKVQGKQIPAKTPVFIECAQADYRKNKVDVRFDNSAASFAQENALKGVFFCNTDRPKSKDAKTAYDKNTMRVLGTAADGSLAYVTADCKYLSANQSYLPVPVSADSELKVFYSEEDYLAYETMLGVDGIGSDAVAPEVYDLTGRRINLPLNALPKGIYIVNHKKYVVR